eukprot:681812-Alexandrium_andersonii.AAC.1
MQTGVCGRSGRSWQPPRAWPTRCDSSGASAPRPSPASGVRGTGGSPSPRPTSTLPSAVLRG